MYSNNYTSSGGKFALCVALSVNVVVSMLFCSEQICFLLSCRLLKSFRSKTISNSLSEEKGLKSISWSQDTWSKLPVFGRGTKNIAPAPRVSSVLCPGLLFIHPCIAWIHWIQSICLLSGVGSRQSVTSSFAGVAFPPLSVMFRSKLKYLLAVITFSFESLFQSDLIFHTKIEKHICFPLTNFEHVVNQLPHGNWKATEIRTHDLFFFSHKQEFWTKITTSCALLDNKESNDSSFYFERPLPVNQILNSNWQFFKFLSECGCHWKIVGVSSKFVFFRRKTPSANISNWPCPHKLWCGVLLYVYKSLYRCLWIWISRIPRFF